MIHYFCFFLRNPWVCDETAESSNSSSVHSQPDSKSRGSHGVLAAQYATPFQTSPPSVPSAPHSHSRGPHSSSHSQSTSGHSGHSGPTESDTHPISGPTPSAVHYNPGRPTGAILQHGQQLLHLQDNGMNGTQSVYSLGGPHLQAPNPGHVRTTPWHDPKVIDYFYL